MQKECIAPEHIADSYIQKNPEFKDLVRLGCEHMYDTCVSAAENDRQPNDHDI